MIIVYTLKAFSTGKLFLYFKDLKFGIMGIFNRQKKEDLEPGIEENQGKCFFETFQGCGGKVES